MNTFGEFFKTNRIALGKTLRQFCDENGYDAGNISKIERGKMPPPTNEDKLHRFADDLRIKISGKEWEKFKDLAAISAGKIPADLQDHDTLARLPVLFRKVREGKFTEDELNVIITKVRES